MKRLYKIVIFFLIIFGVGIYFTVKGINNSFFSEEDQIETVSVKPELLKFVTKL